MLAKKITYKNYNDEDITETFYFNLNESELLEMEYSEAGGYREQLQKIIDTKDSKEIMATFKRIILMAYGEKTADGKFLDKGENQDLAKRFTHTEAYNKLVLELMSDEKALSNFFTAIIPTSIREKAEAEGLLKDHLPAKQ